MIPNLEVKLPDFKFCITTPYPSNDLQICRSNCQISNSPSPLRTLQMTSKCITPYPSNDLQIWRLNCKNFKFCITTLYPSNDLQIWRSKCQNSNSASPLPTLQMTSKFGGQIARFQILHHHSLPFKSPPNLQVKLPNFKFCITTPYPSNDLQISKSN